ncbi:eukaryotic translation initiation factor 3 subunit l [Dermatophagoides pteronyssinus]|uniref:Eukaryotic translation initiation factor 3 subunit L n=2 Tax=Dermatophagoides pteronyssinus TaxID=6956 RepID=A0A6P6YCI6_DERPT|nr:eukaryotic translation initiation factor 3 subunit L-like [Dermatophagoides pteronyssinus]
MMDDHDSDDYDDNGSDYENVPDQIQEFILNLRKSIIERNVYDIQALYENNFNKLTEMYYKSEPWPNENVVKMIIDSNEKDDFIFLVLYKDLYFRHYYSLDGEIPTEIRLKSFFNYCELFNYILTKNTEPLELPNQWLWDIIDEFIYQFQSFTAFKAKAAELSLEDKENINKPNVWNVHAVLNVLYSLVDKSNINQQLREFNNGRDPDLVAGEYGRLIFYKMLGYFSLIGLLRLHCMLGDYYLAIKVLENIDLNRQQLQSMAISRVLACQVTTFYYVGFAYMMMHRYSDAIRTFSNILVYMQRTKPIYNYRTFQMEMIEKQTDRIYRLLAICLALHPQRIDESIMNQVEEKMHDSFIKLRSGDIKEFKSVFKQSCPKIVSFMANNISYRHQIKIFLEEVEQQQKLLEIRSLLKFYTTMTIEKLASIIEIPPEELNRYLLCFKHKMQNYSSTKQLDEFQSGSDVDFYIDKDMIHIADTKVAPRYGDYFLRQIYRFDELYRVVSSINV